MKKKLTKKERLFCQYCALAQSPREAAANAGYRLHPAASAADLMMRPEIGAEIGRLRERSSADCDVTAGLRRLAFGNVADAVRLLFAENLDGIDVESLDLFCVSELKRGKNGVEVKFFDRQRALEKLLEQSDRQRDDGCEPFYRALEDGARVLGQHSDGEWIS